MNLRDLQYLVEVAKLGHFSKAAKACNVSQPTLSMQIRKLEDMLGVQLLERNNKSVMLTTVGKDIVNAAARTLQEAERIHAIARAAKDPQAGELSIGAFPTLAPYIFPALVPAVKQAFPKLQLVLIEDKTDLLLSQLKSGEIECALIALPVEDDEFNVQPIFDEPFYLALPAAHPFAKRKHIALTDLEDQTMLLLDEGHCLRAQSLDICTSIGIGESNSYRATSLETLRNMIAAGAGITFIPQLAIHPDDASVRYLRLRPSGPSRSIAMVWRKTSARGKLYSDIATLLTKAIAPRLHPTQTP
jgi:LysR family hydrogen peroxide-inducible transcriptional activator